VAILGGVGMAIWLIASSGKDEPTSELRMASSRSPSPARSSKLEEIAWDAAKGFVGSACRKLGSKLPF